MQHTSFLPRRLEVQLTLHQGSFKGGGNSRLIRDLAMRVNIDKAGPPDFPRAAVEIEGLSPEETERLTALSFTPLATARNFINVYAGDDDTGLAEVFAGSIITASGEFTGCGHVLKIEAEAGFYGRVTAASPNAVSGSMPLAAFCRSRAAEAGLSFCDEGESSSLRDCIFYGTPVEQARQAAAQAGADLLLDDDEMVLLPRNGARRGNAVKLDAASGLLGSPSITASGIECKCIFNPALRFAGLFILESAMARACGTWRIIKLSHSLSANCPDNAVWESSLTGFPPELSGPAGAFI